MFSILGLFFLVVSLGGNAIVFLLYYRMQRHNTKLKSPADIAEPSFRCSTKRKAGHRRCEVFETG